LAASGVIVAFAHGAVDALAWTLVFFFLALDALALRLSPRAILATTFLEVFVVLVLLAAASAEAGAEKTRPAATAAAGRTRVKNLVGTGATSISIAVSGLVVVPSTRRAVLARILR
jgi:hypothetical protein